MTAGLMLIFGVGLIAMALWFLIAPEGRAGGSGFLFITFGTFGVAAVWMAWCMRRGGG